MIEPGVAYGVAAAASFGGGDFTGGVSSRHAHVLGVVVGAQLSGLAVLVALLVLQGRALPAAELIAVAAVAGAAGVVGLAALYAGMAIGSMGLVTALAGVGSLVIPLVAGFLLRDAAIGPLAVAGIGFAALAGAAASGASRGEVGRRALALAGLAAIGFGAWYVLLDLAAEGGDRWWILVVSRTSASLIALAAVVAVRAPRPRGRILPLVAVSGAFDAGGNVLFVLSAAAIPVGLAAALTGLYPIVTVILARVVLGEALPRLGYLGVAMAVVGIVLIALGG